MPSPISSPSTGRPLDGPYTWRATRTIATTPRLTISPEKSAETGPGAAVWASGSQQWNGTNPAFVAKPQTSSARATMSAVWAWPASPRWSWPKFSAPWLE